MICMRNISVNWIYYLLYTNIHIVYIYIYVCTFLIPYVMMITMWLKNNLKEFLLGVLSYPMSPTTPKKTLTNHNLHVKVSPNTYMILIMHQPPHLVMWQIISYIRAWSSALSIYNEHWKIILRTYLKIILGPTKYLQTQTETWKFSISVDYGSIMLTDDQAP